MWSLTFCAGVADEMRRQHHRDPSPAAADALADALASGACARIFPGREADDDAVPGLDGLRVAANWDLGVALGPPLALDMSRADDAPAPELLLSSFGLPTALLAPRATATALDLRWPPLFSPLTSPPLTTAPHLRSSYLAAPSPRSCLGVTDVDVRVMCALLRAGGAPATGAC